MYGQTVYPPHGIAREEGVGRYPSGASLDSHPQARLARRDALSHIAGVVGGLLVTETLLAACVPLSSTTPAAQPPSAARVQPPEASEAPSGVTVPPDDPAIEAQPVEYPGEDAWILAYLVRPKGDGPFPGVLVCHENRGLTEHIKDVARRLAKAGYVALAVDLLTHQGGMDKISDASQIPALLREIPPERLVQDFRDGLSYLQAQPYVRRDRIGMTGFCFGGGVTWRCATQLPELRAAVPFYGPNPPLEDVPGIQAAVLGIYGEADTRITGGVPAIGEAMKNGQKTFEKIIYPGAEHAFFNDTGTRYQPFAAKDAWARMLAWFGKYLE